MFRASSLRASPQVADPRDEDAHEAYDSHAVSGDPGVSVCVALEVGDSTVRPYLSSSGLDEQPLLDRSISSAGEDLCLKRYVA